MTARKIIADILTAGLHDPISARATAARIHWALQDANLLRPEPDPTPNGDDQIMTTNFIRAIADIIRDARRSPTYDRVEEVAGTILTRLRELGWSPPLPRTRRVHWTQLIRRGFTPNEVIAGRTEPVTRVEVLTGGTVRVHCEGPGGYVEIAAASDGYVEVLEREDVPRNDARLGYVVEPGGVIPLDWEWYDSIHCEWVSRTSGTAHVSDRRLVIVRPPQR